jgi:2-phosphosulfolactate phosphatase
LNIKILHLINGAMLARGLTVIIDVFRAFSTACYAISNGASEIIPVGDINRAYQLKAQSADFILIGERGGKIQPGFDYGNSPSQIEAVDFSGKTIVQTTSAGTQGFANATQATELISGSFVNVDAVVDYICSKSSAQVSLV